MSRTPEQTRIHARSRDMFSGASRFVALKPLIALSLAVFITVIAIASVVAGILISPVDTMNAQTIPVVIPRGAGATQIGKILEEKGIIRSWMVFRLYGQLFPIPGQLQAGTVMLAQNMTLEQIYKQLQTGTDDVWITILEGWRVEEVADALVQSLDQFDREQFLVEAKKDEGRLYPDTYLLPKTATPGAVLRVLRSTFAKRVEQALAQEQQASGLSWNEILTLASLIEREARDPAARRMVAGILLNRIEQGWPLQVDATMQYAKGYDEQEQTWWPVPLAADKSIDSPYNTYQITGLPPAPIANPSLDSIQAALDPTPSTMMYYITDLQGRMHYAETLQQHNANVDKYLR